MTSATRRGRAPARSSAERSAETTAGRLWMLDEVSDATIAPGGSGSTAYDRTIRPPPRAPTTATETWSSAISTAASGGGLAIHEANRLIPTKVLFDERHFVDLAQRRQAVQHLLDGRLA